MEQVGPCLYPLHRCKTIHLVRHAQGYHNLEGDLNVLAYDNDSLLDASLTPNGWEQVAWLRDHVKDTDLKSGIELVVVSPMTRTLQTAVGVFGGGDFQDGDVLPPLMANGVGKSPRRAVSGSACPPFLAVELCREHLGVYPCDKRQSISTYKVQFPGIDFSKVDTDEDTWWISDVRESDEELCQRGLKFLDWLLERKESEIAVVSHSGFLSHMMRLFGGDCGDVVRQEIRSPFANCSLRTIVVADRRGVSKKTSGIKTEFSGGVPSGPSAGSDLKDAVDATL